MPLWFGEQFEGVLTVPFADELHADDPEVQAIEACGVHLAELLQMQSTRFSLDSTRSQRALQQIVEQSQNLTKLIETMLDLSRIE